MSKLTQKLTEAIDIAREVESLTEEIRKDHKRLMLMHRSEDVSAKALFEFECEVQGKKNRREELERDVAENIKSIVTRFGEDE